MVDPNRFLVDPSPVTDYENKHEHRVVLCLLEKCLGQLLGQLSSILGQPIFFYLLIERVWGSLAGCNLDGSYEYNGLMSIREANYRRLS